MTPPPLPQVGIFRTVYPLLSETFITEQAKALCDFQPVMVTRDLVGPSPIQDATQVLGRLRKLVWTVTRSASCFEMPPLRALTAIHAHFGPDAVMALPLAERLGVPILATFHGADITVDPQKAVGRRQRVTERLFHRYQSQLKSRGAAFIAVSDFIRDRLLAAGYPEQRVHRLYIGVDCTRFRPPETGTPTQSRYVLCVGRHTQKKGIDKVVRAWARIESAHPDVRLVQVGAGELTSALQGLAEELGIAHRIEWLGGRPHHEVLELMQHACTFFLPSETAESGDSEALGIVFNEASACGVPVVSTQHGGIPEAIRHGVTGWLAPEGDVERLADYLGRLLSRPEEAAAMGRQGRAWVQERFDIKLQTSRLEALYRDCIAAYRTDPTSAC